MKTQSVYLLYFTQNAWDDIQVVWNLFSNTVCKFDIKNDQSSIRRLCETPFRFHNGNGEVAIYSYRDMIVLCLFSETSDTGPLEERLQESKITPIAKSSLSIGKIIKIEDTVDNIVLEGGELRLHAGETNRYTYSTSLKKDLREFITTTFIRLDIALHRLSKFLREWHFGDSPPFPS